MNGEKGQFLGENVWNSQHVRERCGETKNLNLYIESGKLIKLENQGK